MMQPTFLISKGKRYSYHDFDLASSALRKNLPLSNNKKVMVLSSQPELYYLAFYFCFSHDHGYCPVNIDDNIAMIENKMSIINPGVIITNDNFFLSHWREMGQVYEPIHLPALGNCYLCFRETEFADSFSAEDIRYILFTSGTTGAPKGVPVSNSNIAALTDNMQELFEIEETAVIANTFRFSFDLSIWVMLMAWNNRATIAHISGDDIANGHYMSIYSDCTIICLLPSVLRLMQKKNILQHFNEQKVQHFLFCGEPLHESDVQLLRSHFSRINTFNCYGPTELTIYCTAYKLNQQYHTHNRVVSIGKLNIGSKAYIGDAIVTEDNHIEGELYISGEQVFKGYINDPNSHRFFEYNGELYYKTGDRVIYNKEEELYYYTGRVDREVKYFGHRINLNNLENIFSGISAISDTAAIFSPKYMTIGLFFTSAPGFKLEEHMHLLEGIPDWLTPTHYFPTPDFPLNANFKKDYAALEAFYDQFLEKKFAGH